MTYKQARAEGAQVRKDSARHDRHFYTILEKENDTGEIDHIPMLKTFVVFNVEQIDGLSLTANTVAPQATFDALPQAENLFCNSGANIIEKGQNAFSCHQQMRFLLPERRFFRCR